MKYLKTDNSFCPNWQNSTLVDYKQAFSYLNAINFNFQKVCNECGT